MPFKVIRVTMSMTGRMEGKLCHICIKPMNVEVDSVIVIKTTRGSRYAHPDCAILKNWVEKSEIQKEYLLLESTPH